MGFPGPACHRLRLLYVAAAVAAAAAAACSGSSPSRAQVAPTTTSNATTVRPPISTTLTTTTTPPNGTEASPPGDIPDSQAFVAYTPRGAHFSITVPEGWARATNGSATTWTDKFNSVRLESRS